MCHSPAESKYECTETWFPQTDVEANQGSHSVENIVSPSRKKTCSDQEDSGDPGLYRKTFH